MDIPINTAVIAQPLNWIIVFLMLVFSMLIMETLMAFAGVKAPCGCNSH
jgi:hypothetical protein